MIATNDVVPQNKQKKLAVVVKLIREKYAVEMIILLGNYVFGGDLHEEQNECSSCGCNFDLFIVTKTKEIAEKIGNDSQLSDCIARIIKTPTMIIAHDIDFCNRCLRKGRICFPNLKEEGIFLYDSKCFDLVERKRIYAREHRRIAEEDLGYWFMKARGLLIDYKNAFKQRDFNCAAFLLHQSTENFYYTILLILVGYKPDTHDLERLSKRVAHINPAWLTIFPQGNEKEKRCFELLCKAYVDGQPNEEYVITAEELMWLTDRVEYLREIAQDIHKKKIASI